MTNHEIIIDINPGQPKQTWRDGAIKTLGEALILVLVGYKLYRVLNTLAIKKKARKGRKDE